MNIFGWIIFALINALTLFLIDYDPGKNKLFDNFILGFTGALSSSLFLFFVAKGMTPEFSVTFALVIILESFLMITLLFAKGLGANSLSQPLHQ